MLDEKLCKPVGHESRHFPIRPLRLAARQAVRKQVLKLEMWVSTQTWQAVQQKLHQPGGEDYRVCTYRDIELNPKLSDKVFKLDIPKSAMRIFPQK